MTDWKNNWKNNTGGSLLSLISGMTPGIVDIVNGYNTDTSGIENQLRLDIDKLKNGWELPSTQSLDELMAMQANYKNIDNNYRAGDRFNVPSESDIWGKALTSAASSAASTASLGPWASLGAGLTNLAGSLIGGYTGRNKTQNAINKANSDYMAEANRQNIFRQNSLYNATNNLVAENNRLLASQIAAFGGPLSGYGGNWSNGLTYIGAGGSHEENPLGGVIVGMSEDGKPNQVEQGEYIWEDQDYVFSDRLYIPEEDYEALGLKKSKKKLTYADGAEILQKESAERPNDPISNRGKDAALMNLMQSQEQQRALLAQQEQQEQIEYAMGGGLSRDKDYGSKKKPYPKVKDKDFAGGGRSYPIPTKADAIDALRLAGLHGRSDVKAKVYKKYPELKKALGGHLFWPGGPTNPPYGTRLYGNYKNGHSFISTSPMDAYIPTYENYSVQEMFNPWDTYGTALFAPPRVQRTLSNEAKANVKPYTQESIKQNPTPIYLSDDSEMNRYIAATNPLAVHNSAISDNLGFKYNGLGTTYNAASTTDTNIKGQRDLLPTSGWRTGLRYLPAIAPAISLGYSLFNGPDYSYADELDAAGNAYAEAVGNSGRVTPKFLGDYLAYNPFDRLFYTNELRAQQAATNSAIMNQSSGNRGAALAGLLASGYNSNIGLGKLYREGEEYNRAQRERVAEFNRDTNQYNSTLDMQAQELNARANQAKAEALLNNKYRVLGMKQAIDNQRDQNISLALTNLFNNLGDIGWEAKQGYWNNALINSGVWGIPNASMYDIAYGRRSAACGGKLNRKKKKGLTI